MEENKDMSAESYQRAIRKRRELSLPYIKSRAKELRRGVRFLTFDRMIDSVNLMIRELENIAWSNHL